MAEPQGQKRQRPKRIITSKSKGQKPFAYDAAAENIFRRMRRVKCDETKPVCQRCTKANRECQWSTLEQGVSIGHLASKRFESAEEASGFQFYLSRMAERQHYYAYSKVWGITIPQAAHDHPALKHAILAVGNQQLSSEVQSSWAKDMLMNSVKHYCKAMNDLATSTPRLEVILLCCLLFFSYENMFAFKDRTHAANGMRLLHEYQTKQRTGGLGHDLIMEDLAPLFDGILAELVAISQPPRKESFTEPFRPSIFRPPPLVPRTLPNGYEAFNSLSGIAMHFNAKSEKIYGLSDEYAQVYDKQEIIELLQRWKNATTRLSTSHFNSQAEENRLRILEAQQKTLSIAADAYFPRSEMRFDSHREDFAYIISHCRPVIESGCVIAQPTLGFIPPLFLAATRCRHPKMRREALNLLKRVHRHQAQWDTCTAASIAEWLIQFEERGRSNIRSPSDIPESDRICLFGVNSDPENKTIELRGWMKHGDEQRLNTWNISYTPCSNPLCGGPRGVDSEWPRVNVLLSLGMNVTVASVPSFMFYSPMAIY
ncbi:MAG: hypothetical protein Q9227_007664 [Pyrenula ochraceoflavens]